MRPFAAFPCCIRRLAVWGAVGLAACAGAGAAEAAGEAAKLPPPAAVPVDFVRDVQPIFAQRCYACHSAKKHEGGLRLDAKAAALAGGDSGKVLEPGKSADSRLIKYVAGLDEDYLMPPAGKGERLTAAQVGLLRAWVDAGAVWPDAADAQKKSEHWAYRAPVRPQLPAVKHAAWPKNGIDRLVLARLEEQGLMPAPEADRASLIRRVTLDLTGLPPTVAEVDDFLKDPSPQAYEKVVDRLLASPRYGERWARPWLDAARYADTNGYEKDRERSLWPWRDWVIRALNDDMPFDQFTIEQLAGDLLPGATTSQKVATGFQRNTMLNDEGGINPEEFRVVAVKDRVDATATVWLGTTLDCAQCHSHKYDPFTQKEYYEFFAFFNQTADSGVGNGPELALPTPAEERRMNELKAQIAASELALRARESELAAHPEIWEAALLRSTLPNIKIPAAAYLQYSLAAQAYPAVADSSGNNRRAVLKRAAENPWRNIALHFQDGEHLDCGAVADFERSEAFSCGVWTRPEAVTGGILAKIDAGHGDRGFDLALQDGRLEVRLSHAWPDNAIKISARDALAAGKWRHVLVTYDGSAKAAGLQIYVDGKPAPANVDADKLGDTIHTPVALEIGVRRPKSFYQGLLRDLRIYNRKLTAEEAGALAADHPALAIAALPRDQRTPEEQSELAEYLRSVDAELAKNRGQLAEQRTALAAVHPVTTMVLEELAKPRDNYLMIRGDFRQKGPALTPSVPAALPPFPAGASHVNRLTLARWLVSGQNPLVGRVTVNRFWQAYFGRGIVQTAEDFGAQGERPTNQPLLDWLACEFIARKWSMKSLNRLIVTSATYRQSSSVPAALVARDPENLLLARGPRLRLEYEMLRDTALAAGGLLSGKIGGPSVMPPQPPGIWENSFSFYDTQSRWNAATDDDRYRRGIYTYLRRTAIYPSFMMFDAPSREVCCVRRSRTNTPIQALATLNDPVFVEAAGGLARRAMTEAPGGLENQLSFAFRVCVARQPGAEELQQLKAFYEKAHARFEREPAAAAALVKHARLDVPSANTATLDVKQLAAWTAVANALLNLDETMNKG